MTDLLKPNLALLCRIASIAVHADELTSPDGHDFDRDAIRSLLADPEVADWLKKMGKAALIPVKRKAA